MMKNSHTKIYRSCPNTTSHWCCEKRVLPVVPRQVSTCKHGSKLKTCQHDKDWQTLVASMTISIRLGRKTAEWSNVYLHVAFWCFLYGEIHVLRCFRCDLTNEPKQKLGHSPTFCERQSYHANEARRSVQDGAIGEVCVLAIAKSEQYVTDELDQHHEIQAFSWLLIPGSVLKLDLFRCAPQRLRRVEMFHYINASDLLICCILLVPKKSHPLCDCRFC